MLYMFFIAYSNFNPAACESRRIFGRWCNGQHNNVDRGSTPFLPTTFISYIWVFVFSHWSAKIGGFISQRGVCGCILLS